MISYKLTRSRRKTMGIYIHEDATVEVRAPLSASKADADRLIDEKRDWIDKHLAERRSRNELKTAYTLGYGSAVPFRGKDIPIRAKDGTKAGLDGECFFLPPGLSESQIRGVLEQILRTAAKSILSQQTAAFAGIMGLCPASVKISGAKSRWGSCSGRNGLNFSWRLVMADDALIDYVVVHELAHIKEHNHSARFWSVVAAVLPDHEIRRRGLREFQRKLESMGWF